MAHQHDKRLTGLIDVAEPEVMTPDTTSVLARTKGCARAAVDVHDRLRPQQLLSCSSVECASHRPLSSNLALGGNGLAPSDLIVARLQIAAYQSMGWPGRAQTSKQR